MTYADMITLLLCFFALLLALSLAHQGTLSKTQKAEQAVQPTPVSVDHVTFPPDFDRLNEPEPAAQADRGPSKPVKPAAQAAPQDAALPQAPLSQQETVAKVVCAEQAAPAQPSVAEAQGPLPAPVSPAPVSSVPAQTKASLPEIVERLRTQGGASLDKQGDRITTMQMSSAAFFDSGSATLSPSGQRILRDVAENLLSDAFKGYQITVEGHTDDTPIRTAQFPSNWELSTARAASVVQFLLTRGVPAQRLRAAGYADTFPLAPNRDSQGVALPENQAKNRRVVIKLEKIDKASSPLN